MPPCASFFPEAVRSHLARKRAFQKRNTRATNKQTKRELVRKKSFAEKESNQEYQQQTLLSSRSKCASQQESQARNMRDEQKIQLRANAIHPPTLIRVQRIRHHRVPGPAVILNDDRVVANRGRVDQFFQPWVPLEKAHAYVRVRKPFMVSDVRTVDAFGPKAGVPNVDGE